MPTEGLAPWTELDRVVSRIVQMGRSRLGSGFGKYPLGTMDALKELEPLVGRPEVRAEIAKFYEELSR